jgi:hypothetical protein
MKSFTSRKSALSINWPGRQITICRIFAIRTIKVKFRRFKSLTTKWRLSKGLKINHRPLEDFSSLQNLIEPPQRVTGGAWMLDKDFAGCFQYVQVFYDPKKFANS